MRAPTQLKMPAAVHQPPNHIHTHGKTNKHNRVRIYAERWNIMWIIMLVKARIILTATGGGVHCLVWGSECSGIRWRSLALLLKRRYKLHCSLVKLQSEKMPLLTGCRYGFLYSFCPPTSPLSSTSPHCFSSLLLSRLLPPIWQVGQAEKYVPHTHHPTPAESS